MQGKRILLGITGGIAAYKIAELIRLLIKSGAEVKCIMTPASCDFISPLTVSTLSKNSVAINFWNKDSGEWENHVELGGWADLFLIAPLTANSLAKMVSGLSDNLLITTYLSAKCPVMVAPAMDLDMYTHSTTKRNLALLENDGVNVLPVGSGELASGLVGQGRMLEPQELFDRIQDSFKIKLTFEGKHFLITAGPTYELIDPVRYIGNHSSGKMGFALAKELLKRGADVTLVSGPTKEELSHNKLNLIKISSAKQMLNAVQDVWKNVAGGIFSAAVADYRPKTVADEKIKKKSEELTIELVKNPDILAWAGENKKNQLLVGFALETNDLIENAKSKLKKKNLDLIVANSLQNEGAGFGYDTNKVTILDRYNNLVDLELMKKNQVAKSIVDIIEQKL